MTDHALIHQSGAPASEIILNQPEKRNAINASMWRALGEAVSAAEQDKDTKVLIIRGEGAHFAAGADISEFEKTYATTQSAAAYTQTMLGSLALLENCAKPTIAMINGACVGGGCSIALACDFRFAAKNARFGVTPGKLGLVYSLADTRRLVQTVGVSNAKDLLFTGRLIEASDAEKMGLCDRLYSEDTLYKQTQCFADDIASTSQWSLRATKKTFKMLSDGRADDAPEALKIMLEAFEGDDFQEGYRAFLEKRKPNFPVK